MLFKGLGVQKDAQTPWWLRPCAWLSSMSSQVWVSAGSPWVGWLGRYKNERHCGGLSLVLLQLKDRPWNYLWREGNFFPVIGFYLIAIWPFKAVESYMKPYFFPPSSFRAGANLNRTWVSHDFNIWQLCLPRIWHLNRFRAIPLLSKDFCMISNTNKSLLSFRGHGTYMEEEKLHASVAGVVERVNKLICVKPLKTR